MSSKYTLREWVVASTLLGLYMLPLLLLGENAHIRVHDNLDSNLAWYKVLSESGQVFGSIDAKIPQIINGELSRNAFGTEFSGIVWLHHFLPTMSAYFVSQLLTRIFALIGMYVLLRDYILPDTTSQGVQIGVSLAFALTPFWPSGMLSTLGMPLALWAFLNLYTRQKGIISFLVLTLLPLYSSFVLGFFFFLAAIALWIIYDLVIKRSFRLSFTLGFVYMTLVYLLTEYRLVSSFLVKGEPNSRDEYVHAHLNLLETFRLAVKNYVLGHTHVMSVHGIIILPVLWIAFYLVVKQRLAKHYQTFMFLFILNALLSLWYAFWFYKGWEPVINRFPFLNSFNFARFHFLRPMVIYMSFAQALMIIYRFNHSKRTIKWLVVSQLVILFIFNDEIIYHNKPTVKEFYAVEQFNEIKDYISIPIQQYRVVSIGIHPAIAQYNGMYTLDTYNNFYPLTYKHQFRKIIEKELKKNRTIQEYFDHWGGRCYIYSAELGKHYMYRKDSKKIIRHLQLNTNVLKAMGGDYILSALPIKQTNQTLSLEKVFHSSESAWTIYLYRIKS